MQREPFDPDMVAGPQQVDERTNRASKDVIGAAIDVHRALGPGYSESVYEEALCIEMSMREIPYEQQKPFTVYYKNHRVGRGQMDLLVAETLVVELKTVEKIAPLHVAQAMSYLRANKLKLALILNFNTPVLKEGIQRVIL